MENVGGVGDELPLARKGIGLDLAVDFDGRDRAPFDRLAAGLNSGRIDRRGDHGVEFGRRDVLQDLYTTGISLGPLREGALVGVRSRSKENFPYVRRKSVRMIVFRAGSVSIKPLVERRPFRFHNPVTCAFWRRTVWVITSSTSGTAEGSRQR